MIVYLLSSYICEYIRIFIATLVSTNTNRSYCNGTRLCGIGCYSNPEARTVSAQIPPQCANTTTVTFVKFNKAVIITFTSEINDCHYVFFVVWTRTQRRFES